MDETDFPDTLADDVMLSSIETEFVTVVAVAPVAYTSVGVELDEVGK